jgi:hypothetical protein
VRLCPLLVSLNHASEHVGLRSEAFVLVLFPLRLVVLLVVAAMGVSRVGDLLLIPSALSNFGLSTIILLAHKL